MWSPAYLGGLLCGSSLLARPLVVCGTIIFLTGRISLNFIIFCQIISSHRTKLLCVMKKQNFHVKNWCTVHAYRVYFLTHQVLRRSPWYSKICSTVVSWQDVTFKEWQQTLKLAILLTSVSTEHTLIRRKCSKFMSSNLNAFYSVLIVRVSTESELLQDLCLSTFVMCDVTF